MPRSFRLAVRLALGSYKRLGNELYASEQVAAFQTPDLSRTGPADTPSTRPPHRVVAHKRCEARTGS